MSFPDLTHLESCLPRSTESTSPASNRLEWNTGSWPTISISLANLMSIICHKWLINAIGWAIPFFGKVTAFLRTEKNNLKRFPRVNHFLYRCADFPFYWFAREQAVLDYETGLKRSTVECFPRAFPDDRCGTSVPNDDSKGG